MNWILYCYQLYYIYYKLSDESANIFRCIILHIYETFRHHVIRELYPFSPQLKAILTLLFQLLYPFALLRRFFLVRDLFFREALHYSCLNLKRSYTRIRHYIFDRTLRLFETSKTGESRMRVKRSKSSSLFYLFFYLIRQGRVDRNRIRRHTATTTRLCTASRAHFTSYRRDLDFGRSR